MMNVRIVCSFHVLEWNHVKTGKIGGGLFGEKRGFSMSFKSNGDGKASGRRTGSGSEDDGLFRK